MTALEQQEKLRKALRTCPDDKHKTSFFNLPKLNTNVQINYS